MSAFLPHPIHHFACVLFRVLAVLLLTACPVPAQNNGSPPLTEADIAARLKRWSAPAVDPALQKVLIPMAQEAANQLQQAEESKREAAAFAKQTELLPQQAAALREAANRPVPLPEDISLPSAKAPLEELELTAGRLNAAIEQARRDVANARSLPRQATERRRELNTTLTELSARILEARSGSAPPGGNGAAADAPELAEGKNLVRQASLTAAEAQASAAEAELAWLDAAGTTNWSSLTLEDALRRQSAWEAAGAALAKRIEDQRTKSATSTLATAERNQADAPAELRPALERVTRRAQENRDLVETLIPEAEARLREVEAETRRWLETAQRTRQKLSRLGATGVVGVELRQQRQSLPSPAELRLRSGNRQETLNEVEVARLALEEELAALPAPAAGTATPESQALQAQRESISNLLQTYSRFYTTLVRLEEAAQQLTAVVAQHREFIHQNILWIPSTLPVGAASLASLGASVRWLISGISDPLLLQSWLQGLVRQPVTMGFWLLLLLLLFLIQRFGRHRLSALARLAAQPDPGFRPTAAAVFWTALIVLPWPAVLWVTAVPWLSAPASSPFALAWAAALQGTAGILLGLEWARQPLRQNGLADAHFGWQDSLVRDLRWRFRRMLAVFIPCALFGLTFWQSDEVRHDSAERVCLVVALLASAWGLHRLWRSGRKAAGLPPRGLPRLGWMAGHALSVLVPAALAVLALRGFLYTAEALTRCLALSLLAASGFLIARSLFFRWHELHRRHLRTTRARQLRDAREASRAAAQAAATTSENLPAGTGTSDLPPDPPADSITGPDIDESGQEMRSLVDLVGFILAVAVAWAIWADVLPAAKTLAAYPLENALSTSPPDPAPSPAGSSAVPFPGALTAASSSAVSPGAAAATTASGTSRATWLGVLLALASASLTLMAARRIPGALQFVLTSHLALDAGARFAISTITRYVILIAGIVFTLDLIGITWSSVQWLAAALTVGLGFGLQEIFANFFSGLIILAERPIRLGDIVTIDNITGSVSRIQIRATTIRAADGKDYVVPNKEFITGKLLNWTLTDTATRQDIAVGIAYGSDPAAALGLLAKIAAAHPAVLKDPAPIVSFELFGDSALQLMLRFHVGTLEKRLPTLTDLNCAIARDFAAAGIEIPFPQRDLHLRTVPQGFAFSPNPIPIPIPNPNPIPIPIPESPPAAPGT